MPKLSSLILSIPLSSIETFSFRVLAIVSQPVRGKLISQVLGLDFKLNENITVLIPLNTKEQPMQGKTQSGAVLDNVREISQMTSFSVYIDHTASYGADPNSIRNVMNGGRYRFTCKRQLDLQSLYQGQGAQIAYLTPQLDELPSYHEEEKHVKDSQTVRELQKRVATLEKEKMRLEKGLDDQNRGPGPGVGMAASEGQTVEEGIKTAQKDIEDLRRRIKTAEQEIEALQRQNDKVNLEDYDAKLLEIQEEVKELDEKRSGINDNMATQDNLRDFGEDFRQAIGRRISGDDY
ncbi:hypothetical protein FPRO06_13791 [Fusarium proliferatum]|nr:hypothetical protein FPRO06_13791 [Fusarium proliferatum]CVL12522.1 uncharacterized protein FPRN_15118 [Fusarium proliferatum]